MEGGPVMAAPATTHWPADAISSVSALEAHAANLTRRLEERDSRIASLQETVLSLRAQLNTPLKEGVQGGMQVSGMVQQAPAGPSEGAVQAGAAKRDKVGDSPRARVLRATAQDTKQVLRH